MAHDLHFLQASKGKRQVENTERRRPERASPPKAGHQLALVIQVLLDLLPHVEDGTVPAGEGSGGTVLQDSRDHKGDHPLWFRRPLCCLTALLLWDFSTFTESLK